MNRIKISYVLKNKVPYTPLLFLSTIFLIVGVSSYIVSGDLQNITSAIALSALFFVGSFVSGYVHISEYYFTTSPKFLLSKESNKMTNRINELKFLDSNDINRKSELIGLQEMQKRYDIAIDSLMD